MKMPLFKKRLTEKMQEQGYQTIFFSIESTSFIKRLENRLYLTVTVEFSRFDKEAFTGEFYLSWFPNCLNIDNPSAIYFKRVGSFLTLEERKKRLNNQKENLRVSVDAWWYKDDANVIDDFIQAVSLCEPRFLAQDNIFEKALYNHSLPSLHQRLLAIIEIAQNQSYVYPDLSYQPKNNPFKIDPVWYKAAEVVCSEKYVSKQVVRDMAVKAFNFEKFRKLDGNYLLENV